jgi:PPOX class probable F420-dependent enzyme
MDSKNLATLYDAPAFAWDDVRASLEAGFTQRPDYRCWLTTLNPDGSPHVTGVGAVFHGGTFWFVSGRAARKGRNAQRDPRVALSLALGPFDLVVEGRAELVTDPDTVAELAERYRTVEGWPAQPDESGTALTAEYSAPSAGPPPWHIFRVEPTSAHAVKGEEPGGAMRWRF